MAGLSLKILSFRGRLCRQEERQLGRANKGGQVGRSSSIVSKKVGRSSRIVSKSCARQHGSSGNRLGAAPEGTESGHGDGGEVNRARQRGLLGIRRKPGCMQRLKALIVFLESRG